MPKSRAQSFAKCANDWGTHIVLGTRLKRRFDYADESTRGRRVAESRSKVLVVEDSNFLRIANERILIKAG